MSLLNDALRAAEERQQRPDVSGAYTGGGAPSSRRGKGWLVMFVLLVGLAIAAASVYWLIWSDRPTSTTIASAPPAESPEISAPEPAPVVALQPQTKEPSPVRTKPVVTQEPQPQPEPRPQQKSEPKPKPAEATEVAEPATAREASEANTAVTVQSPANAGDTVTQDIPVVKTTPRSPAAIDRKAAKELEELVAGGQMVQAERRLARLTEDQAAPRSRYVVARSLLVDGQAERALGWLPEETVANDAPLRVLRARAQHADGQLDAAVATLQSRLPAVAEQPEYRVTLATLLQQQGQSQEAARHWAELIAWDDSRAPWWVGLAIALEAQGEAGSAARAYEQAAALPGLPPSLADYVQRRLRALGAG